MGGGGEGGREGEGRREESSSDATSTLLSLQFQAQRVQMVVWMLQRRLLVQLHKYIFFVPNEKLITPLSASTTSSTAESSISTVQVWCSLPPLRCRYGVVLHLHGACVV